MARDPRDRSYPASTWMKNLSRRIQRFWSQVKKTDSCWLWTGGVAQFGHGRMGYNLYAHRFSFWLHTGVIPQDGIFVCHKCDVPACVNPDHLFLGTNRDNMLDAYAKGRLDNSGEKNWKCRIGVAQAAEILANFDNTAAYIAEMAAKHGVTKNTIRQVLRGKHFTAKEKTNE